MPEFGPNFDFIDIEKDLVKIDKLNQRGVLNELNCNEQTFPLDKRETYLR